MEDPEIEQLARTRRLARGLRTAARRAIVLARKYRDEEGPSGARETACVRQAFAWRASARDLAARKGPGLASTRPESDSARRQAG